ncbi:hypothetical protein Tco_0362856 [Tanacetum coccineum]
MGEQDIPPPTINAIAWIPIIRKGGKKSLHNNGVTSASPTLRLPKQWLQGRIQKEFKKHLAFRIPDEYILKFHQLLLDALITSAWESIKIWWLSNSDSQILACLSLEKSVQMDGDDLEELDLRWQVAMLTVRRSWKKRSYGDNGRSNAPTNESSSHALVAQDGLGGYDWSNDFEVEPVNYALMAISSSSSSSSSDSEVQKCSKQCLESFKCLQKNYDTEREKHNKAKLEIRGYEIALESLESRILKHEKNESSDEDSTSANDRSSKAEGYKAVPPPITGNFLTPRADISFAGLAWKYAIRINSFESQTSELNTKNKWTKVKGRAQTRPVSTARPSISTVRPSINTVRPVNTVVHVWRPKEKYLDHVSKDSGSFILKKVEYVDPKGISKSAVVDCGCSSLCISQCLPLNYEDYNGGFVAFGSDPKGGKITPNFDFDNVYFVDELKFNLFSVSQMCDKKNSVLFTDTECLILSPSFKLLDESQVVLRAPRKEDVYSLDLKNIFPS